MINIPAVSNVILPPPIDSEACLAERDKPDECFDEYEDVRQGVLTLLQQLRPHEPLVIGSGPTLSGLPTSEPALTAGRRDVFSADLTGSRRDVVNLGQAPRSPAATHPALPVPRFARTDSSEVVVPRGLRMAIETVLRASIPAAADPVVARLDVTPMAERPVSDQRPASAAVPDARGAAGEPPRAPVSERLDKAPPAPTLLANPVSDNLQVTRSTPSSSPEKAIPLHTRLPVPTNDLADKTVEAYLRLPFAKDGAVGFVNVNKPAGDLTAQLYLTPSNADISRHLLQNLHSAESTWRLNDSHDSTEQQGGGANEQADDETDESQPQAKQQDRKG